MSYDDNTPSNNKQQPLSLCSRRLSSFPGPDLEVMIGEKDRIYRYHAIIMACHSEFVDRVLSSPAGTKNQTQMRISFPEIEEDTWEKMMAFLEPGGFGKLQMEDIKEVLPLYEKYQFKDALVYLDSYIHDLLVDEYYGIYKGRDECALLAEMVHQMPQSLPNSSSTAVGFATKVLKRMAFESEEQIRVLLPLVENEDALLLSLVKVTKGRHSKTLSVDEMRAITRSESFPSEIFLKANQIEEVEEITRQLDVDHITVSGPEEVSGSYNMKLQDSRSNDTDPGAMQFLYNRDSYNGKKAIEAMDPFGLVWELFDYRDREEVDGEAAENPQQERRVLYRWDSGYSSLFPPKHGWHPVEGVGKISGVRYQLKRR